MSVVSLSIVPVNFSPGAACIDGLSVLFHFSNRDTWKVCLLNQLLSSVWVIPSARLWTFLGKSLREHMFSEFLGEICRPRNAGSKGRYILIL